MTVPACPAWLWRAPVFLVLSLCLAQGAAHAQALVMDTEPNNTPQTAQRIDGEVRIRGTMAGSDQDGYLWRVDAKQALSPWTMTLQGIAGALTIVDVARLSHGPDGQTVTGVNKFFTVGSRDGAHPVSVDELLFEPGEYLLGVARGGGGRPPLGQAGFGQLGTALAAGETPSPGDGTDALPAQGYQLDMQAGRAFRADELGAKNSRETPRALRVNETVSARANAEPSSWYGLRLDEQHAAQRWDLDVRTTVGHRLKVDLQDADGQVLASADTDAYGAMAFRDLVLPAGDYTVRVDGPAQALHRLKLSSVGERVEGAEAEPNDRWPTANRIDLFQGVDGRLQTDRDVDLFRFELSPEQADQRLALTLTLPDAAKVRVCLLDDQGKDMQCRDVQGTSRLDGLALAAGAYGVSVARGSEGQTYRLQLLPDGPHAAGLETEPNDAWTRASPLVLGERVRGTLSARDKDFFRVEVVGEPQLWRFQVNGDGLYELSYANGRGRVEQSVRAGKGERRLQLDSLYLVQGTHYIMVEGVGPGSYTLLSRVQGQPLPVADAAGAVGPAASEAEAASAPDGAADHALAAVVRHPDVEWEPNGSLDRMQPLHLGQTRTGGFHHASDQDWYRFVLTGYDHIRLALTAPADEGGRMRARLYWEGDRVAAREVPAGVESVIEGVFPPGLYRLELATWQAVEQPYRVSLSRLPRYGCGADCEPNDNLGMAGVLPVDGVIEGRHNAQPGSEDPDWFALPVRAQDTTWQFRPTPAVRLGVYNEASDELTRLRDPAADQPYTAEVPAGEQAYLVVYAREDYRVQAMPGDTLLPADPAALSDLSMTLTMPASQVGAYARFGQRLEGELVLRNTGGHTLALALDATATDARWVVTTPALVSVASGQSLAVPVSVQVPDDAWALSPVQVAVRAVHEGGAMVHAHVDIDVSADASLVVPALHWPLPEALRGGFNLASLMLGAQLVQTDSLKRVQKPEALFDDVVVGQSGAAFRPLSVRAPAHVVVQLAGDGQADIAGFVFHPLSQARVPDMPRRVEVALSDDGEHFDTVWRGHLEPHVHEQPVVLDTPRKARFARLTIWHTQTGSRSGDTTLGEWQVVAVPGTAVALPRPFNLAAPALGGQVVHAEPPFQLDERHQDLIQPVLRADLPKNARVTVDVEQDAALSWVVGFRHNRAARIDRLVWGEDRAPDRGEPIDSVDVAVSLQGPLGPWQPLGTWALARGGEREWRLDTPVWARFVRFSTPRQAERAALRLPTSVRVYEAASQDDASSILAVWGHHRAVAGYELAHPPVPPASLDASRRNVSRDTADVLANDQAVSGHVSVGEQEHWYRVTVPDGMNRLDMSLTDPMSLRAHLAAETPSGEPLVLDAGAPDEASGQWSLMAESGTELLLRVYEPPRHVIFSWDGSGSVSAYTQQVRNALSAYAYGLKPGRDLANLLPFSSNLQLSDWSGDPHQMMQAVNETASTSSSEAERTLATASRALAGREGSRAVVLLTDAETGTDRALWPALAEGRPSVMAVTMGGSGGSQRLMQNWALVNGGHYSYVRHAGDMVVALDRASVLLRNPASYTLHVTARYVEPPADGSLVVRSAPPEQRKAGTVRPGPATAIILDASGSMLQRLGGQRRIDIAKRGLTEALASQLPPGTPVSLRVFGHKEANSCRSDLEIPLGPLNLDAARRTIARVQAKNLARTPIADSLALVRQDLAQVRGPRNIVLVTDGEETCDGDPEAVIRELVADGYDVRLNIIGFALDDPILEQIFGEWARMGGGDYFSANDRESFSSAMSAALQLDYAVFNAVGEQVADGLVDGDPVSLPPGQYEVRFPQLPDQPGLPARIESAQQSSVALP